MNTRSIINKQNRDRLTKGYTMAEVLMVVAIMGILAAVAFLGIFALRRNMKQTQADKNAEIIFEAAQRQMVSVVAFDPDSTITLKNRANGIYAPAGIPDVNPDDYNMIPANPVTPETPETGRNSIQTLLLEGQVADDLYADGWVVEYDKTSLQVKSVFYFEDGTYSDFYSDINTNQTLRQNRAKRLEYQKENKKVVGYFDGSTSSMNDNKVKVYGVAKIENGEELKAKVAVCATGSEAKDKEYLLTITTTGVNSGAKAVQQIKLTNLMMDPWTKMRTSSVTIVLDSLKNNMQFKDTYGSIADDGIGFLTDSTNGFITINGFGQILNTDGTITDRNFIPGEDVEISVSAETTDHAFTDSMSEVKVTTNSLYYSKSNDHGTYTADVKCGRHLQNLDVATSGLNLQDFLTAMKSENFTEMKAVQVDDIDFTGDEWKDTYETNGSVRKFIPITNRYLESYSGGSKVGEYFIKRLIVDTAGKTNAGLFSEFRGDKIEYVTLIDEQIKGSASTANGSIGGLVGSIPDGIGKVKVNGCQQYMSADTYNQGMDAAKSDWMNGARNIGGLIGESGRELEISLSSASTVITGATQYAGGLVGNAAKVTLNKSYADCYLGGSNIGGLIGNCADTSTINGSFSAGFVIDQALAAGGKIAGMTTSSVASVTDSYTVFSFGGVLDYPAPVTFYTTVAGTAEQSALYYVPASFDIPQSNKIGSDRSASAMKDSTKTGFGSGIFAFRTDTSYGFNSVPYKLTDGTASLVGYAYPMIILENGKTLNQYGDWHDAISRLTVRFLYSDQALALKDAGEITLADPLVPTNDGKYYFTEDYANAIVAHQEIQEYTNAFIPQQNYQLAGREKTILYWEFTYEGQTYYYVPDSADSYFPTDGGRKYRGKIYLASDCLNNILAGNVAPWDGVTPRNINNPLESVTQSIDVYARFYITDTIQYVRMHYRIYNDKTRTTSIGRYIGRAVVVKTGNKYTITTEAHSNVGGYHFFGWATTENGWDAGLNSTILPSEIAQEQAQTLTITTDVIERGDVYAIYEKIDNYPVNVEFCAYDSNNDGWGSSIYQPQYNTYSTEDWVGGSYTRRIYLPKTADVVGYDLHKYNNTNDYKALFFAADGTRDINKDTLIQYDSPYTSLDAALAAGAAYVEINITTPGTYVVTYRGQGARFYRVDKYYLNTVSGGNAYTYHDTQQKERIGVTYDDGIVGSNISNDKLLPDDDGFELDHYGASHTPLIGNVGDNETYVCQAYYRRKQFEMFYDLNGGTYDDGSKKGYHTFEEVPYGMPLANVGFINQTTTGAIQLNMSGCEFGGWVYYKYAEVMDRGSYDGLTAYTANTMPKEAVIAVAQWHVGPNTKVILEIYRQDRENALAGTSFNDLAVPNENKTYLLQKSMDITAAVDYNANNNTKIQRKEALLNAANYNTLKNLIINSYGTRINNADSEMYRLLNGKETQYYFTDAVTTNPLLQWTTIKPEIVNGEVVLRLYYDRKIITATLDYGSSSNSNNMNQYAERDLNQALANATTDLRITVTSYVAGYTYYGWNRIPYYYYSIAMKALYGAHFDEPPYVWTDELWFSYGNTGKRHLESFIDEVGNIGDSSSANARNVWTFTYSQTNGNNNCKVFLETIDGSGTAVQIGGTGTAYPFDTANSNYTYKQSNNVTNTFNAGTYHGYTLWAKQLNGGTLTSAADGTGYDIDNANNFYFIRKSGLQLFLNQAHDVSTHTDFAPYVGRYKDVFILPGASQVEHPTDPTKYTFGGWYATSDFSGNPITAFTMDDHDAQVFAKWIPKDITLTYHPEYPDVNDNSAIFTETAKFNRAVGALHQFTTADNGRILVDSTGTYYRYRPDGEDRDSTYRFDGWWRKDPVTGKYTVQVTGSEVLYDDNTDVYARWTQIEGYAYLKIRCVQVDNTSIVHEEMSAHKILLGSPQYIYAPLVNAATWNQSGEDWSGYYPTQTRVTQTFYGEEPEIVFYYSKGTALNYKVNYFVTFKPYGTTGGSNEEITLKTQEYIQSVNSAVVVPPFFDGYYLTNDVTSVPVASNESGKIINFYYEPDLRTIQMVAKTLYGSHQSFPEIVVDDLKSIFDLYPSALAGYELVPMYKLYDLQGNELTPNYILASEKDSYMQNLPNGTYRALGRVYLQKDGVNLMVLWDSPNYVNFMMVNDDGE
jgi:prepilin-type N-terminal cleavage/methylation domain-containing protein